MRFFMSAILASNLLFSDVALADPGLAPGKPAGVRAANGERQEAFLLGGSAFLALAIGIFLIYGNKGSTVASSTGTS